MQGLKPIKEILPNKATNIPLKSTQSHTEPQKKDKSDNDRVFLDKPKKKKENKVKPTLRHKKLFKNLTGNYRTKKEALLDAGYSEKTAEEPSRVIESKGFRQLLDEMIPDESIGKKINQLLNSKQIRSMTISSRVSDDKITETLESQGFKVIKIQDIGGDIEEEDEDGNLITKFYKRKVCLYSAPDNMAQDKALDKLCKIKGFYKEDHKHSLTIEEVMAKSLLDDDDEEDYEK